MILVDDIPCTEDWAEHMVELTGERLRAVVGFKVESLCPKTVYVGMKFFQFPTRRDLIDLQETLCWFFRGFIVRAEVYTPVNARFARFYGFTTVGPNIVERRF